MDAISSSGVSPTTGCEVLIRSISESNVQSELPPKIRRVPQMLREQTSIKKEFEKFFEPRVVSIGPYHHGNPKLKLMEELKPKFAHRFVSRLIKDTASREADQHQFGTLINEFYHKIHKEIQELRKRYADENSTSKYGDEDLARMLFLDGCFILQFIENRQGTNSEQPQMMKSHYEAFVEQDLFLLENQLPFKVLQILAEKTQSHQSNASKDGHFAMIEKFIYKNNKIAEPKNDEKNNRWETQPPAHLLEMLWRILLNFNQHKPELVETHKWWKPQQLAHLLKPLRKILNCNQHKPEPDAAAKMDKQNTPTKPDGTAEVNKLNTDANAGDNRSRRNIVKEIFVGWIEKVSSQKCPNRVSNGFSYRNVKELTAVGIKMKCSKSSYLTDVSFESPAFLFGQLRLPPITMDDSTGPKFMNLMAYEMCPDVTDDDFRVTSYVCFLDSLIDHADDVKELRKARVIHNLLGSDEEVAKLFNDIGTDLVPNSTTYRKVMENIQIHYDSKVKSWIAVFIDRHFSTPWTVLATLAALYALFLSSAQTYFQVFPRPGACDPICEYIIRRTHI
ncbi:UPF0481 protein At3g47200-like [Malania oleifera]|uniref:UPF0481 protein At3g47200-like n=1 Tax=Malania oleifera TaxID=397392 RepID=UPI0025AE9F47|nr:UPF0481 protein At3g47200-like [Malania oleifera]